MFVFQYRFILFFIFCLVLVQWSHAALPSPPVYCEATKEFITTFEYLKKREDLSGMADNAARTAMTVAKGCNGSALRFINTVEILDKTELTKRDVLKTSTELAQLKDESVKSFITIFKYAYSQDSLDMSLQNAMKLARSLAIDTHASPLVTEKDFQKLVEFCLNKEGIDQTKAFCSKYVQDIVSQTDLFNVSIADSFIEFYKLSVSKEGLNLLPKDAIRFSSQLIKIHPRAFENFLSAYAYAGSQEGLAYKKQDALRFALALGQRSKALEVPAHE